MLDVFAVDAIYYHPKDSSISLRDIFRIEHTVLLTVKSSETVSDNSPLKDLPTDSAAISQPS